MCAQRLHRIGLLPRRHRDVAVGDRRGGDTAQDGHNPLPRQARSSQIVGRRDAALVEHARDRGGRPSRASIASEERTQLGRDTVIVRQGTLSFSGLRSGDFLGRMERFGKPGFTIMSDYGKSEEVTGNR